MFHATLLMLSTCFMHTLCHIRAFSGTNLLTRCRSASCCFLLFLVSEILVRKYSRNWTKSKPRGLFSHEASRSPKERRRGATEGPHPRAARPPLGRAALWCGAPVPPLDLPFRLQIASVTKPPVPRATIRKTFQSRRHRDAKIWGTGVSVPARCRSGEVPPEDFSIEARGCTGSYVVNLSPMYFNTIIS